jgi:hypothetical protein
VLINHALVCISLGRFLKFIGPRQRRDAVLVNAQENVVTAIDIALDATMIQHAEAANARLLKVFPKGFALDATHHPHISMLQRYARTADLDKVYSAAGKGWLTTRQRERSF